MGINKVVYDSSVLIDLTSDTVTEDVLMYGYTAHSADGSEIVGTLFYEWPEYVYFSDAICDSGNNEISDSDDDILMSNIIYGKIY